MPADSAHAPVLAHFGIDASAQIGHGGEATVYALDADRVLRVYHGEPHDLDALAPLYASFATCDLGFVPPQIFDHGVIAGLTYSVDRRIPGRSLMDMLRDLSGQRRMQALDAYAAAAERIRELPYPENHFGELIRDDAIRSSSWREYLLARMEASLAASNAWLPADVPGLDRTAAWLRDAIGRLPEPAPTLVHGDYFPGNVMMDESLTVTGVIDFGPLTVVGDAMMDVASGVIFLEVARGFHPNDTTHVMARAVERHGEGISAIVNTYRAWYAVRFSPYKEDDERLYDWCVRSLVVPN